MKRALSIILAAILLFGVIPLSASAAENPDLADTGTISRVDLEITAPKAGATPSVTATAVNSYQQYQVNGVVWYEIDSDDNKTRMETDSVFRAGYQYEPHIFLEAKDGNEFFYQYYYIAVSCYVNGDSNTSKVSVSGERPQDMICVYYQFPKLEDTGLKYVSVNIAQPAPGNGPSFSAWTTESNAGYKVNDYTGGYYTNGVYWYDDTDSKVLYADSNAKFIVGHQYTVRFYLVPKEGYSFYLKTREIKGYVNGSAATVAAYAGADSNPDRRICLMYQFTCAYLPCDSIGFNGVTVPRAGETADFSMPSPVYPRRYHAYTGVYSNYYFHNGIAWYDKTDGAYLSVGDTFKADHDYTCYIEAEVSTAYIFSDPVNGTINGYTASVSALGTMSTNAYRLLQRDYSTWSNITSVAVSNIVEPVAGQHPVFAAQVPSDVHYLVEEDFSNDPWINGIVWKNISDNAYMTASDTFVAGKQYSVTVSLLRDSPYFFVPSVTGTLNGKTATINKYGDGTSNIGVSYTFTAKSVTKISQVEVTGVDFPKPNAMPAYGASVPSGKGYSVQQTSIGESLLNGVLWYNVTDKMNMNFSDRFVSGKQYRAIVYLQTTGLEYEFASSSGLSGTLNTHTAVIERVSNKSIRVTYTYTCRSMSTVSSVSVNVTTPIAGQNPSYVVSLPSGADYSINSVNDGLYQNGVQWDRIVDDTYYWVDPSSAFVKGERYMVTVLLKPTDEYTHFADTVTGTVNGKTAKVKISAANAKNRYIEYTFTCQADPNAVTVSGTATSFLKNSAEVKIELRQGDAVKYSTTVTGNSASYTIPDVTKGAYTMRVTKQDHAARDYAVTVSGNTTLDVKIHPKGDINGDGKITNYDYSRVNQHTCGTKKLTDYAFVCADVNGDGKITNFDAGKINQHASGTKFLW